MITDAQKELYKLYWERKNDRPLLAVTAPKDKQDWSALPKKPESIEERWLDSNYVIKKFRTGMSNTYYGGAAFPQIFANYGPDIMGAICGGCDIEFGESTSWALHGVESFSSMADIVFDEGNKWWQGIFKLTEDLLKDANGEYIVGITDLHPGTDCLVSLRGPENLCYDLFEEPELVKKFERQVFEVYKKVYQNLFDITSKQGGVSNWMGIWSDKRWYVVGSDFSCLVSPEDYEEFVAPGIEREISFLDQSIYHLDGPQALRHLDRILKFEKLNGVQWVYGAGQPSASHWIDVLKKIQNAGKNIEITVLPKDVPALCDNLRPEGLFMTCRASSVREAKELEAYASGNSK